MENPVADGYDALLMEVSLTLELRPYRRRVLVVASKPA
jgi:hypothetical protein